MRASRRTPTAAPRLAVVLLGPMAVLGCTGPPPQDGPPTTAPTRSDPPTQSPPAPSDDGQEAPATPPTSTSAAPESAPSTQRPFAQRPFEITIAATGDVLAHHAVNESAREFARQSGGEDVFDYSPMFDDVSPLLSEADLALCHLETPLSSDHSSLTAPGTLTFNTPPELATALAGAGIDGCDFASNHTMDQGLEGLATTEAVVRDAGLGYAGPTASRDRSGRAETYRVPVASGDPVTVAHLAYTYTYPNEGSPTTHIPAEAPWLELASWPSIGGEGIREQARAARREGADVVVVSMHWGQEYQVLPTQDQTRLARELLESPDVDLVLGTHAHVIQPCERIGEQHVIHGLGNVLSNQGFDVNPALAPGTQEGMVAVATVRRDDEGRLSTGFAYHPTRVEIDPVDGATHVVRLVGPDTPTWERTTSAVDLLGGCGARALPP
ncbi:CapA family protein [Serinicoccus marinus]|uniref:CapA family protein n=1 Tax=Serinicoccus marinus TaxID=247333 RepID=UPI0012F79B94|nr:CapA family protein [Serinicoccus marinus]